MGVQNTHTCMSCVQVILNIYSLESNDAGAWDGLDAEYVADPPSGEVPTDLVLAVHTR